MRVTFTFLLVFTVFSLLAQQPVFSGKAINKEANPVLASNFTEYKVFQLDLADFDAFVKAKNEYRRFQLELGAKSFDLEIYAHDMRGPSYIITAHSETGDETFGPGENLTYRGQIQGDYATKAALTIDEDFLYGMILDGKHTYFLEPLWYFQPEADKNLIVFYKSEDVIPHPGNFCGAMELHKHGEEYKPAPEDLEKVNGICYELELSIASDGLMFNSYGSVAAVEAHNVAVMNNVQTNYDDEFADEVLFVIVEQYVSTSPGADPWTANTDAGILLNSFTNWGPGGFSQTHDLGSLWTDRNLDGSTIGIAWLSAVCTSSRYHVLQDFTSNADLLRVLTAHEIGHNFSLTHDPSGSPTIMAPAVNNTNQWSAQSVNQMDAYVPRPCMAVCPPPLPPTALFTSNLTQICEGSMVTFYDMSLNGPDSWSWSFPGGTPSSSTEQNPTVTYPNAGVYNVTLTASNSNGNGNTTIPGYIVVGPGGTDFFHLTDFESGMGGWTIDNPDNNTTWTNATVGGTRDGSQAMRIDNYNYNASGQRDRLVSPVFDLTGRNNLTLEIEYAYARYDATHSDSLVVYVSPNGGASYVRVFDDAENGTGNFATHPDQTSIFNPDETADWCYDGTFGNSCLSIDLSAYDGNPNVRIRIENVNDYGNVMYVDNIRLFSDCFQALPPIAAFTSDITDGCVPMVVNFSDQSENQPTTWLWSFPGGTPAASNLQNPSIAYTTPGTFDVTLTVVNSAGNNTITLQDYITVGEPPTADFTYTNVGTTYDFVNLSTTNADNYLWNFGDGATSTLENPSHTYAQDGTYAVTLTVTNECGSSMDLEVITIVTPPIAGFSAQPTSGCAPLNVFFTDESTENVVTWDWSFPGGFPATSSVPDPLVTYANPGVYDVTLTVTNTAGTNTFTQSLYIDVQGAPTADFSSAINGNTVDFSNASVDATSYLWDFGDGSAPSSQADPSHTYVLDGSYDVMLIAINNCGLDTLIQTIDIVNNQPPVAGFSFDPASGCAPFTVDYTDQSSGATSWNWTFPGGVPSSSTEPNPTVVYPNAGTYSATLVVTNANGDNTLTQTDIIVVTDVPIADFNSSVAGNTVDFTNNSTDATSYSWDFGDGNSSSDADPSHTYAMEGTYDVVLTATNDCGSVTYTETIVVSSMPSAAFSADPVSGCAPLIVNFLDESSENTESWSWDFPGGNPSSSTAQNPVVEYTSPGTYTVTLTVTNGSGSNSVTQTNYVIVEDLPGAGFTETVNLDTLDLTNTSVDAASYFWDFGDGNTSTDADPQYVYSEDGTYDVMLVATNSCGSDTTFSEVVILTPPAAGFSADFTEGCVPFTVQFTNESSENVTGWTWDFPGGDPASSTDPDPLVTYNSPGTYDVTLIVSNDAGTSSVVESGYIIVGDVPTAGFNSSISDMEVDFTNSSVDADSYTWDFGDGNSSTEVDPIHTYDMEGIYTVTLTAENECGEVTVTEEVEIVLPPTAGFSADITEGCAPLIVQFSDESSENVTGWSWSFPGGNPNSSTDPNPLVEYTTAGTYDVTLVVTNSAGESTATETTFIVVDDVPAAGFTNTVNGVTVDFTNGSSNADTYLWEFGDGDTSTDADPSHDYPGDGTYTVILTATNDCGSVEVVQEVVIGTPPVAGFNANITEGCAPLTVEFVDESSENVTAWNWSFPGGTPATSTDQNPVVVYNTAGTFDVTLEVTNNTGDNMVTQVGYIVVNDVPSAGFSSNSVDLDVDFTNSSTNATSYLWDFGDGNISAEVNPSHTYDAGGNYTVTLTATNDCGSVEVTETVTLLLPPLAGFSFDPAEGCAPLTVSFINESSDNVDSFSWDFPGGVPATSTDENPVVSYDTPGAYDVTLTVTNQVGESTVTESQVIVVAGPPAAGFTITQDGDEADFSNISVDADTYLWDFGDGNTSDLENPVHIYDQEGTYVVTLTAINDCGTEVVEETIVVSFAGPVAAFESDISGGCEPLTVSFTSLASENAENFEWYLPGADPSYSTDENPVVEYPAIGSFDVTFIVHNANGSDTMTVTDMIDVSPAPQATFSETIDAATISFDNQSTNANSYFWSFGNGATSTAFEPIHTYSQVGTYTVMLIASNDCGADTSTMIVEIDAMIPTAAFSGNPQVGCGPLTVQFTDQSGGEPTDWNWTFPGGTPSSSTEQNPVVVYNSPGVYNVSLNVQNLAGSNLIVQNQFITVLAGPQAGFTYSSSQLEVFFNNISEGASNFFWDFGDGSTSINPSPSHVYAQPGIYLVTMTATNECGEMTITQEVSVGLTSVADLPLRNLLKIYPNPNNGQFNLEMSGTAQSGELDLTILNVLGQQLQHETVEMSPGGWSRTYDLRSEAKGVYFLRLRLGDQTATHRIVIE